jgi:hypothetical protein
MRPMQPIRYLLLRVRDSLLLLGLWPVLAWASDNHLADDLGSIPAVAYFVTFVSTFLGGLAGTLHRMSKHLEPGAKGIRHPKIFVAANLLGGAAAGWFSFLVGTHAGTPTLLVQGIVLLSAFGGAAIVERFVDKWLPPPKLNN